jgi:hypothetical protein
MGSVAFLGAAVLMPLRNNPRKRTNNISRISAITKKQIELYMVRDYNLYTATKPKSIINYGVIFRYLDKNLS